MTAPTQTFEIIIGMFALGAVLFTIYALNVARANDQAGADEFIQISGGLLIVYGIGNMVGPQLGGRLMDAMGPNGFFTAMGCVYALYGLYATWRSLRSRAIHPALRPDFRVVPPLPASTPELLALDIRTGGMTRSLVSASRTQVREARRLRAEGTQTSVPPRHSNSK